MAFVENWDETTPSNSTEAVSIDDEIRKIKTALRERLAVEHEFEEVESSSNIGEHKTGSARISIGLASNKPINDAVNPGAMYYATDTQEFLVDTGSSWLVLLNAKVIVSSTQPSTPTDNLIWIKI